MNDTVLVFAVAAGGGVSVIGWIAAVAVARRPVPETGDRDVYIELRRLERLKLILIAVLAVVVVGLGFVTNNINRSIRHVEDVEANQACIIALERTPVPATVTDEQLEARHCPTPPPFTP
jgi:hypothetical protein